MDTAWALRGPDGAGLRPRLRGRSPARPLLPHAGALPQCVTLDKLEVAPSEAALVARALELLAERRFWAGIVFLGPEERRDLAQPRGPGHVRVKIRMYIDAVTRTNKIRDRCGRGQCGRGLGGHRV